MSRGLVAGMIFACVGVVGASATSAQPLPAPQQAQEPPRELLRVLPPDAGEPGPRITPYLSTQLDRAWAQDEARQQTFARLRTEADVLRLQAELRQRALQIIGGLPDTRTPLNARITGTIQRDGYTIEKVVFESLPGLHVTALVYVPDASVEVAAGAPSRDGRRPAVLVACGHSPLGKAFVNYQLIAARLAKRGFIVICWDPVGQGERSQFWDAAAARSRYNLVCGEHAILGALATVAGTSLTRWMVWDGMRVVDYLLTRADVDPARLAITGTSGGGFQSLWIGALDPRIAVVAPSAFVTSLPMRMANRIFDDPDSDPEQDPPGLVSEGVDHAGLLLLAYPRAIHVSAAVKDFFPIEGTRKTVREVATVYARLGHADRIVLKEGYHGHAYSEENQRSAFAFIERMFGGKQAAFPRPLDAVTTMEPEALRSTRTGQVRVDLEGRSLVDVIRDDFKARRATTRVDLAAMYRARNGGATRGAAEPALASAKGMSTRAPASAATSAVAGMPVTSIHVGRAEWDGVVIDRYLLRYAGRLQMPLLHVHQRRGAARDVARAGGGRVVLSLGLDGHIEPADWRDVRRTVVEDGREVVSFDLRGTGETRMPYRVNDAAPTTPIDEAALYAHPVASVLANQVYNSLLTGRPYFLEALEDVEIAARFARQELRATEVAVQGRGTASLLARAAAHVLTLPLIVDEARGSAAPHLDWSQIIEEGRELWPIQYVLPGGAYVQLRQQPR